MPDNKKLFRIVIGFYSGGTQINERELFIKADNIKNAETIATKIYIRNLMKSNPIQIASSEEVATYEREDEDIT